MTFDPVRTGPLSLFHSSCHSVESVHVEASDAMISSRIASSAFTASSSMQTQRGCTEHSRYTNRVINPVDVMSCISQATRFWSVTQGMNQSMRKSCFADELEGNLGGCYTRSARRQRRSSASERSTFRRFRSSHPRPTKSKSSDDIVVTTKVTMAVESTLLTY